MRSVTPCASSPESQPKPVQVVADLVERRDDRQAQRLAELVVLRAAAGRDVDDARALVLADLVPGDDAVLVAARPPRRPPSTAGSSSNGPP